MRWRWPDGMGVTVALGLALTPLLVGLSGVPAVSAAVLGGAAGAVFALALLRPGQTKGWIGLALAGAMLLAPFVLGFTAAPQPLWSHWLAGVLLGLAALWSLARAGADAAA